MFNITNTLHQRPAPQTAIAAICLACGNKQQLG